ncbi:MAG: rhomboid family intramembrane serine protease [Cyclobacteriaceae bacterium]|nr:rhomboid family intramembrane serine protease [Cyclobacteriaceae bacterium]
MEFNFTIAIIVITSAISLYAMNSREVLSRFMMNPYMVTQRGQYYRLLTSGLIHKDFTHLIFNMFSLFFFGPNLESIFGMIFGSLGPVYFIALYVLGIIVSDLPTVLKHKSNPGYNSLGASGAVSSVIFACILFDPLSNLYLYFAIPIKGFIFAAIYLIYSYMSAKNSRDGINHDAHLYGALFGILFCIVLYPDSIRIFIEQISHWKMI